jgi:RNA polymerase sigma-70 factor (ECF subfamily)
MRAAPAAKPSFAVIDDYKQSILREKKPGEVVSIEGLLSYQETVFRICMGYSRNYAEAEDLTQEVYLKAYRGLASLVDPLLAKEWLFRITKNACHDYLKKARRRGALLRRAAHELDNTSDPAFDEDLARQIRLLKEAIWHLPEKLRTIFVLREYGHLSYEELAGTLKLKIGTVMSRLNRARVRLAAALKEKIHEQT